MAFTLRFDQRQRWYLDGYKQQRNFMCIYIYVVCALGARTHKFHFKECVTCMMMMLCVCDSVLWTCRAKIYRETTIGIHSVSGSARSSAFQHSFEWFFFLFFHFISISSVNCRLDRSWYLFALHCGLRVRVTLHRNEWEWCAFVT